METQKKRDVGHDNEKLIMTDRKKVNVLHKEGLMRTKRKRGDVETEKEGLMRTERKRGDMRHDLEGLVRTEKKR